MIVTGGSRGIGLGIAGHLAAAGYRVIAVARTESEALTSLAAGASGRLAFRRADLGDIAAIPSFIRALRAEFGPFYGLVNNAGIGTPGVLANMPDAAIEQLVRLNVISPITLTRHVVRSMLAGHGGRIVNIGSIGAFTGYSGLSVYNATKAALLGFTRSLAREVGAVGITVNAVAPGFVETDMTASLDDHDRAQIRRRSALRRMPQVEDVAGTVAFLLSDKARNITGTVITVDAGSTA